MNKFKFIFVVFMMTFIGTANAFAQRLAKQSMATQCETNRTAKIAQFLEYATGLKFGQASDKEIDFNEQGYALTSVKTYRYFKYVEGSFIEKQLYSVYLWMFDVKKYKPESLAAEYNSIVSDIERFLGKPDKKISNKYSDYYTEWSGLVGLCWDNDTVSLRIVDEQRHAELKKINNERKNRALLSLPVFGEEDKTREQRIKSGEIPEPVIPMTEALALAEKGDGKGYYQLAVRYAKGEGVEKDDEAAMKFLKKAYDANYPRAIFAVALGTEYCLGKYSSDEVEPSSSKLLGVNFSSAGILCVHGLINEEGSEKMRRLLDMRQALRGRENWEIDNGITNEEFTAWVRSDYKKAKSLGIGAAEKELARFERRIELAQVKVKADIEKEAVQKKNDELARRLIEGAAGKTRKFVPFPSSQKLPYQQALDGAEKRDSKSYYWLAYYFAKGEGVDRDGEAALKFLKKAVDANDPAACYTFGLLLENKALQNENGWSVGDQETSEGFEDLHFNLRPFGAAAWYTSVSKSGNKCLTNTVAVAHVESLYQKAIDGGFPYATNDIARLQRKIADCKKRIAEKQVEKERREEVANKALSLLDDPAKMSEEDKAARDAEAECELWNSWPNKLDAESTAKIVAQAAEKFNCAFYGNILDWGLTFTNNWKRGSGLSLIVELQTTAEYALQKLDVEGRCVWISNENNLIDAEELRWISEEREKALAANQLKWSTEHGMGIEEAKAKYAKWKEEHPIGRPLGGLRRPGMLGGGSLRARRLQRQAEEELKRVREAKAAAEKK